MKSLVINIMFLLLLVGAWCPGVICADLSSTNYTVSDSFVSGGGGADISSSSYQLNDGSIDFMSKEAMASTNYDVDGFIGAGGGIKAPVIQSVTPGALSRFFTDETPSYAVTAQNPGTGSLEYQVKEGSTVKAAWQSSNNLSYSISGSDKGRHELSFMVRNSDGTSLTSKSQYLFRRPTK